MKVITNHRPRQLVDFIELPAKEQDYFDYVLAHDWDTPRFVQYKGCWYDVFDATAIRVHRNAYGSILGQYVVDEDIPLAKWDAIFGDSYFSGVVFKLTEDDMVICGRVYS